MTALGKAIQFTDEELDELAIVTEEDIEAVQKRWVKTSNRWAKNLLVAGRRGSNDNDPDDPTGSAAP